MYCSEDCALLTRECIGCGETFRVPRKRSDRNFACSLACRRRPEPVPKVTLSCGECGATFERWPSKTDHNRGKFCSRNCAALGRPINGRPSVISNAAIDLYRANTRLAFETEKRIGRWSIDLAIPDRRLAIELDGEYWHSIPAMVEKDQRKDAYLTAKGWDVRRIPMTRADTAETVALRIAQEVAR